MNPEQEMTELNELSDDDILVHMNRQEVETLSALQPSGVTRDNPWNIPEFHELSDLLESDPQVKDVLSEAMKEFTSSNKYGKEELADEGRRELPPLPQLEDNREAESGEAEALGEMGTNGDTEIVLMPKSLFEFLWDNVPDEYREVNEHTGFPQFGFWSGLLGVVGGTLGSLIPGVGPIAGPMIGSALGGLGGGAIDYINRPRNAPMNIKRYNPEDEEYDEDDEELIREIEKEPDFNFLEELLLKGMGNGIGGFSPEKGIMEMLGLGGKSAPGGSHEDKRKILAATLNERRNQRKYFKNQQKAHVMDYLGKLGNHREYMMSHHPILTQKGNTYKQHDPYLQNMEMIKNYLNPKTNTVKLVDNFLENLPRYKDGGEIKKRHLNPIKKSKYIDGDESGQADNVMVDVPVHSYVIDASTVSQIGDGSSNNGAKRLRDYFEKIPSILLEERTMIPCALSAGEYVISPDKVNGLGDGNVKKGIKILKKFVKNLRDHKDMNVESIPKPTKDLGFYFKKSGVR
jgi:hypothetical protein